MERAAVGRRHVLDACVERMFARLYETSDAYEQAMLQRSLHNTMKAWHATKEN